MGTSESGDVTYFVAFGVLAANENGDGETATMGADNLYELNDEAGGWSTRFVARLASGDSPEWEGDQPLADTAFVTARVSPNGRYFAFMSSASLTGYDNVDASPVANGARDEEVYLYDSETAALRCVSCDPSGARPTGVFDQVLSGEGLGLVVDRRKVWLGHWLAGNDPGWTPESLTGALVQSRYLSNDGRLFFNSPDDLVPDARNQKEDVYEYEPSGVGSCESPTGGCVALLSSGSSEEESAFIEATPEGAGVFFLTDAQLLPQDTDTAFDIYDARECTSASPCLTPSAAAGSGCAGTDTCRPAAPAQPAQIEASAGGSSGPGSTGAANGGRAGGAVKSSKTSHPRPLTRAQQLANALRLCKRHYPHARRKRVKCEAQARRRYSPHRQPGKSSGRGHRNHHEAKKR